MIKMTKTKRMMEMSSEACYKKNKSSQADTSVTNNKKIIIVF